MELIKHDGYLSRHQCVVSAGTDLIIGEAGEGYTIWPAVARRDDDNVAVFMRR